MSVSRIFPFAIPLFNSIYIASKRGGRVWQRNGKWYAVKEVLEMTSWISSFQADLRVYITPVIRMGNPRKLPLPHSPWKPSSLETITTDKKLTSEICPESPQFREINPFSRNLNFYTSEFVFTLTRFFFFSLKSFFFLIYRYLLFFYQVE